MIQDLRELFLLDPDVVFLNHGSFGACPRPVFEVYQHWQYELERQPVLFLGRRSDALLDEARAALAAFVNADADDVIFVPNATLGLNTVARSLNLSPGDALLTTDHEYGAMDLMWTFICRQTGAHCIRCPIPLPVASHEVFIERLWSAVTPRTKVIFLSHITSPTALIFPIAEICRRARKAGILTIIDGAHAPGHISVDMQRIGADFYAGNCHKWLCAPKGSGFLYARREHHHMIDPLVISWGWDDTGTFVSRNQWQGTRDIAAFLSVPAAIDFLNSHNWDAVRQRCHTLASETRQRASDLTRLPPIQPDSSDWFGQMVTIALPPCDIATVKDRLYADYCIEVPLMNWNGQPLMRVSYQGYNTRDDMDTLLTALGAIFG